MSKVPYFIGYSIGCIVKLLLVLITLMVMSVIFLFILRAFGYYVME